MDFVMDGLQVAEAGLAVGVLLALALVASAKLVSRLLVRHMELRFQVLDVELRQHSRSSAELAAALTRLSDSLEQLRSALPREYWRREDAIRTEVMINAKLDAIARATCRDRGSPSGVPHA